MTALFSGVEPMRTLSGHFCEIILNLDQWFRISYRAPAAPLFSGAEPFEQFLKRALWEIFM